MVPTKFKKSQIIFLFLMLISLLLFLTPLISSSLRPTYLYFIINLLIIALGAEAGLLSCFSKPPPTPNPTVTSPDSAASPEAEIVQKSGSDRIVGTVLKVDHRDREVTRNVGNTDKNLAAKKSASVPSIFFIEGGESRETEVEDHDATVEQDEDDQEEEVGGQELFNKAEMFIGNFYKQLEMQREESWQKIHGFHQKAF